MILLDTHVWLWWIADPDRLSEPATKAIEEAMIQRSVLISSISVWEVAMLVDRGRLALKMDVESWIASSESLAYCRFVQVSNPIAVAAARLPGHAPRDPADRIIIATSGHMNVPLITKDEKILGYEGVKSLW